MNGVCAIIVFLCVQELATASYYRIPKRHFKKLAKQEIKQAMNAPQTVPTRTIPVVLPVAEKLTLLPEVSVTNIEPDNEHTDSNQVPILKPYEPLVKHDLPKMPTLPILALLPIVTSLPVVNVAPKVTGKLPDAVVNMTNDSLDDDDDDDDDDIYLEEIEEIDVTKSISVVEEVKYEIVEQREKTSPILHKIHRAEEFKRSIWLDRQDPRKLGRGSERDGNIDLKEYLHRIAERAELHRN